MTARSAFVSPCGAIRHVVEINDRSYAVQPAVAAEIKRLRNIQQGAEGGGSGHPRRAA